MNLTTLLAETTRRLQFTATPTATVTTRLTAFLNDAQRRLLTLPGMEQLRDDQTTFASIAGQTRYGLPPNIARIRSIVDVTGMRRLKPLRRDDYRWMDPGLTATGVPEVYLPVGQSFVALQPAAATGLWAVSSAAGDTAIRVFVEGTTTGGFKYVTASAGTLLTGTSRVQLGTRADIINVSTFSLSLAAQGYVSLYNAATLGTELARIEPGRTATKYWTIDLFPQPSSATTYTVDYTRVITDMSNASDEPFLPEDFHYVLPIMASRREYVYNDDQKRYTLMAAEEADAIKALRAWVLYPPDYKVRNVDPVHDYPDGSNLGGYFPAGRW